MRRINQSTNLEKKPAFQFRTALLDKYFYNFLKW